MKLGPVMFMQGHKDMINDMILLVWACHCTSHQVKYL